MAEKADPKKMFNLEKNTFLTTTDEVTFSDVERYLEVCLKEKRFQKGTHVTIICGIHSSSDGSPASSDFQFVGGYYSVFSRLQERQASVINEMGYILGTVMPIDTLRRFERINGERVQKYYLSDGSKAAIKAKFEDLRHGITPQFFIFATCYSFRSQINQILRSSGLISVLSIRQEKGELTEGKIFELDEGQKEILKIVADEQPKNIVLWGTSGTGKTILLTETLAMKVNHYRKEGVNMKIIVSSWWDYANPTYGSPWALGLLSSLAGNWPPESSNNQLMKDFKEKYLCHLVSEENIKFITFSELCSGIIF